MKRLLHIIASPRGEQSRTLKVSRAFLDAFKQKNPGHSIDELDLFKEKLPELTVRRIDGKYMLLGGKDMPAEYRGDWDAIISQIERFLAADGYLVSAPMWNFGIPYRLKQYIDIILQPKYLFQYTAKGPEGLVKGKKMAVVTSRGGDYSPGSPFSAYDFQEPYIRAAFGFAGIADIEFINAQPMDALGPEVAQAKITEAQAMARIVAEKF
jgi:FMN-dependent NADH-azoreductase